MNPLVAWVRRASTASLVAAGVAVVTVFVAANWIAGLGGATAAPPPPVSLKGLSLQLLSATAPAGLTAHFTYVDTLFPDPSLMPPDLAANAGPLLGSSQGRLWWRPGQLRIDFQSSAGDTQLLVNGNRALLYDASSGLAMSAILPPLSLPSLLRTIVGDASTAADAGRNTIAVGVPHPTVTAGRPSYTLTIQPRGDRRVLLSAAQIVTDAATGLPLRLDLFGRGTRGPVLEMILSGVRIGPVDPSDLRIRLPFGVHPQAITISLPPSIGATTPCNAPLRLAGLALETCRQTSGGPNVSGQLLIYGRGAGSLLVFEQATGSNPTGGLWQLLPSVAVGQQAGRELTTGLGTLVRFGRGGVEYTLVASLPRPLVERAARGL